MKLYRLIPERAVDCPAGVEGCKHYDPEKYVEIDPTALETAIADLVVGASGIDRHSIHWDVVTESLIDEALGGNE